MHSPQMFHPVTRTTCGLFAALVGSGLMMLPVQASTLGLQGAAVVLLATSMALLSGYMAIVGRLPTSRLWGVIAAPTLLAFLIIPVFGVVSLIHEVIAGEVELSVWWVALFAFILGRMSAQSSSRRRGAAESDAASTPNGDDGAV